MTKNWRVPLKPKTYDLNFAKVVMKEVTTKHRRQKYESFVLLLTSTSIQY